VDARLPSRTIAKVLGHTRLARDQPDTHIVSHESDKVHLTNSEPRSYIEEARNLVRHCVEPRPVAESTKGAIRRASQLLNLSFSRTKDIWYGDPRLRIDAMEMDAIRQVADQAELTRAVTAVEFTIKRLLILGSPAALELIPDLNEAIQLLRCNATS
jgi:hypothetical protein